MPENPELPVKELSKAIRRADRRIDTHIDKLVNILKSSPDWDTEYQQVTQELVKEIQSQRRWRRCLQVLFAVSVVISGALFWNDWQEGNFVEKVKNAQLALKFEDDGDSKSVGLPIIVDTTNLSHDEIAAKSISDRVQSFGKHYGIGPDRRLRLSALTVQDNGIRWFLKPVVPYNERLGFIELSERFGSLTLEQWSERLKIGDDGRSYKNLDTFLIRVIDYERADPENIESMLQWKVQFGEKKEEEVIWNPTVLPVLQSPVARVESEPLYLFHDGWDHLYIVTIGLGKYVSDPEPTGAIHRVTSYVRRLSFM